jgi:starch synthase
MKAIILTREYPPDVYGGAGVHVEYLARELHKRIDLEVRCFGEPRQGAVAFEPWGDLASANAALKTVSVDLAMAAEANGAQIVHSHTWYAIFGGHLTKLLHGLPHVVTTHSLEPMRPWKAEQLGAGGYALSSFCERTGVENADSVIAVSSAMREDVRSAYPQVDGRIEVIYNGIDTDQYTPDPGTDALAKHGVAEDVPIVLFVGRVTRQKGIVHLLDASLEIDPAAQLVFCAGAPDEPEIERATRERVERLRAAREGVVWIEEMLPKHEVIQLLSHAAVFCVPSIYEPLGIVNLEAMACEAPVVASAVGGIPEVVVDGETGLLVPVELGADGNPSDPARFASDFASRVNELLADPARATGMGKAGRQRAVEQFSWASIAERTIELYDRLVSSAAPA